MNHIYFSKNDIYSGNASLKEVDIVVTHGNSIFSRLIQIATQSKWNHCALILNDNGDLVELTGEGIQKNNLFTKYHKNDYYIIRINMSEEDRNQVIEYALYMLSKHCKYGVWTIVSITLKILLKSTLQLRKEGTQICSEFVAVALEHGGIIWNKDVEIITPADLYNYFIKK